MKQKEGKIFFQILIDEELKKKIKDNAEMEGMKLSAYIEKLLLKVFEEKEND